MDVGIGLPNQVRGVGPDGIVEWAKRAEAAGFSTLGTIDRLAYPGYEPLTALAAAAAVTERIVLMTDILIAPLRSNTALLAKEAATVDHLSGGRLVLGVAPGGREDDYVLGGVDFAGRGRAFDDQLEELVRLWREGAVAPASPRGERPRLMVGGTNPRAYRRAATYADGWTMGGGPPDAMAATAPKVREAFVQAGREEEPRLVALCYYALGPDAEAAARASLGHYYGWLGDYADRIVASAVTDAETSRAYVDAFSQAGADELIMFPAATGPDQVDLLAEAVL